MVLVHHVSASFPLTPNLGSYWGPKIEDGPEFVSFVGYGSLQTELCLSPCLGLGNLDFGFQPYDSNISDFRTTVCLGSASQCPLSWLVTTRPFLFFFEVHDGHLVALRIFGRPAFTYSYALEQWHLPNFFGALPDSSM